MSDAASELGGSLRQRHKTIREQQVNLATQDFGSTGNEYIGLPSEETSFDFGHELRLELRRASEVSSRGSRLSVEGQGFRNASCDVSMRRYACLES